MVWLWTQCIASGSVANISGVLLISQMTWYQVKTTKKSKLLDKPRPSTCMRTISDGASFHQAWHSTEEEKKLIQLDYQIFMSVLNSILVSIENFTNRINLIYL